MTSATGSNFVAQAGQVVVKPAGQGLVRLSLAPEVLAALATAQSQILSLQAQVAALTAQVAALAARGSAGPPGPSGPPGQSFLTFGSWSAGDVIPTDGSIRTQGAWNRDTGHEFVNTAWPAVNAPVWEAH